MFSKMIFLIPVLLLQTETTATREQELIDVQNALDLSRLTTILSVALITLLMLLTINIYKNYQLRNEIKRLKSQNF